MLEEDKFNMKNIDLSEKTNVSSQAELIKRINTSTQESYKNLQLLVVRTDSPISQIDAKIKKTMETKSNR